MYMYVCVYIYIYMYVAIAGGLILMSERLAKVTISYKQVVIRFIKTTIPRPWAQRAPSSARSARDPSPKQVIFL